MKKYIWAGLSLMLLNPCVASANNGQIPEDIYSKLSAVLDIQEKLDRNESINYEDYAILFPSASEFKTKVEYKRDRNSSGMTINLMGADSIRLAEEPGVITFEMGSDIIEKNGLVQTFGQRVELGDRLINDYEYLAADNGSNAKLIIRLRENVTYTVNQNAYGIVINLNKNARAVPRVVLDAGHGAHDPGATSKITGVQEKALTLKTTLALRDILLAKGYDVVLTREADVYPTLQARAKLANDVDGDIFISVHYNSAANAKVHGLETYAYNTPDNNLLAESIHKSLISGTGSYNRGVKTGNKLIVLNQTRVPAILVELGFLSNPDEARRVLSDSHQTVLAEALAKGIDNYFGR